VGVIDYWENLKRYAIANLAYWCLTSRKERSVYSYKLRAESTTKSRKPPAHFLFKI